MSYSKTKQTPRQMANHNKKDVGIDKEFFLSPTLSESDY